VVLFPTAYCLLPTAYCLPIPEVEPVTIAERLAASLTPQKDHFGLRRVSTLPGSVYLS